MGKRDNDLMPAQMRDPNRTQLALLAGLGGAYALYALFSYERRLPVMCPFRRLTGIRCPLCGLTTSLGHLLHRDVRGAFRAHPLGPVMIVTAGVWYLRSVLTLAQQGPSTRGD